MINKEAFIRCMGTNHPTDYKRIEDWVLKLEDWIQKGLRNIHFFVHQNIALGSPLLLDRFIAELNKKLGCNLQIPKTLNDSGPKPS